jgi:hypothetical protein
MIKEIKSLPISEETLGAYLEGNLPEHERMEVEKLLENDYELREFVDEVSADDINYDESIYDYFPDFDSEFSLPEIPKQTDESDDIEIVAVDDEFDLEVIDNVFDEHETDEHESYDLPETTANDFDNDFIEFDDNL